MNCDEFVELVTAFLDGVLDTQTEQRFIEHLAECEGCETYLDQIRQTVQSLGHLPAESLSDQTRDHLLAAFRDFPRS